MVILRTVIGAVGDVTGLQVLLGLPSGLTEAAVAAVSRWKFRPALPESRPVPVDSMVTVTFSLQ